jgi:hypothetical protein
MRQISKVDAAGQAAINSRNLFLIPFAYKWKTMHGKTPAADFEDHVVQSLMNHDARHGHFSQPAPVHKHLGTPGATVMPIVAQPGAPSSPQLVEYRRGVRPLPAEPGTSTSRRVVDPQVARDEEIAKELQDAINRAGVQPRKSFADLDGSSADGLSVLEPVRRKNKKGKEVQEGNRKGGRQIVGQGKERQAKGSEMKSKVISQASRRKPTRKVSSPSSASSGDEWLEPGMQDKPIPKGEARRSTRGGKARKPNSSASEVEVVSPAPGKRGSESSDEELPVSTDVTKSGRGGVVDKCGRAIPKASGKTFDEPCERCERLERPCEKDVKGNACVGCKQLKTGCSHSMSKSSNRKKGAVTDSGSTRPDVVSEATPRPQQRASAKKANEIIDVTGKLLAHVNKTDKEERTKKRRAGQRRGSKRESMEVVDVIQGK